MNDTYLVTGGASGIGLEFACQVAKAEMNCVTFDIIDFPEEFNNTQLSKYIHHIKVDLTDEAELTKAFDKAVAQFEKINKFFNNAGILGTRSNFLNISRPEINSIFEVNFFALWKCMQLQLNHLLIHDGGAIVNNASSSGLRGSKNYPIYCASKHAVVGLSKSLALSYAHKNVRINTVCPSLVETPMTKLEREVYGGNKKEDASSNPSGRIAVPNDIAQTAIWLLSNDAGFINGQCLSIDGGETA